MESQDEQLDALKKRETLTDAEMQDLIKLSPTGTFKSGPNLNKLGLVDINMKLLNLFWKCQDDIYSLRNT